MPSSRRTLRSYKLDAHHICSKIIYRYCCCDCTLMEREDLIRRYNTISLSHLSNRYHHTMTDGLYLATAVMYGRIRLALTLLTRIDPLEAFLELPNQRSNFLSTFEVSTNSARFYYLMYFRLCAMNKMSSSYSVNSLDFYCHLCSLFDPLTRNPPQPGCLCTHCTSYRPYVQGVYDSLLCAPDKLGRQDRTNVALLFSLFGIDVFNMRFNAPFSENTTDLLHYFVAAIWCTYVGETEGLKRRWLLAQFKRLFPAILAEYQTLSQSTLSSGPWSTMLEPFFKDANQVLRTPFSLNHQCRSLIRQSLRRNGGLPYKVYELEIPKCLQLYINLEIDVRRWESRICSLIHNQ